MTVLYALIIIIGSSSGSSYTSIQQNFRNKEACEAALTKVTGPLYEKRIPVHVAVCVSVGPRTDGQ